jgi:hypothetical protein
MSITIEPGKSYVARDGEKWTDPQPVTDEPGYAWSLLGEDKVRCYFTTDGKFWLDSTESASDLVAEWDEPAPAPDVAKALAEALEEAVSFAKAANHALVGQDPERAPVWDAALALYREGRS